MSPDPTPPRPSRRWLLATCILAGLTHSAAYFLSALTQEDPAAGSVKIAGRVLEPGDPAYLDSSSRSPDEREYLYLAVNLAETGELRLPDGMAAKRMPLYPFLLSLVYRTQQPALWHSGALFMQALLAACTTVMIAAIAYRAADARAGLVAGVTAALYAPFLYMQMRFLTETLSMFLLVAAALVYIEFGLRRGPVGAQCIGLAVVSALLGLGILARPNAVLLLIPFAADADLRAGAGRVRVARVVVLMIPALACAAGWAWRNERTVGRFTLSTSGGLNFYLGHHADYSRRPGMDHVDYDAFDRLRIEEGLSEVEVDRVLFSKGLAFVREHPAQTLMNAMKKVRVWLKPTTRTFGPTLLVLISAVIVVAGAAGRRAGLLDRPRSNLWLASLAVLALSVLASGAVMLEDYAPWTSAAYVVSLGVPALLFMRTRLRLRGLFLGIVGCQLLAAVAFVPLSRLRWTIDWVFIAAIAVLVSNVCAWLTVSQGRHARAGGGASN